MADEVCLPESAIAWQLRGSWGSLKEVGISLAGRGRIRGYVVYVATTNAYALIWDGRGELHVPLQRVQAVRSIHFHEDWGRPVGPPPRRQTILPWIHPGQLALDIPAT
jgi:hypothetical protein